MQVQDIMSRPVECVDPEATLVEAAVMMRTHNIGMLPVKQFDRIAGLITDRDIVVRAVAAGAEPSKTRVRDVMSRSPRFCYTDQEIQAAAKLMEDFKVRRLPVLDRDDRLVGVLSLGDLPGRGEGHKLVGEILEAVAARHT